jgi:hypothetical protein
VKYGQLPFHKPTGRGTILGESVAPVWKRLASSLVDYGWPAVAVYLLGPDIEATAPHIIVAAAAITNIVVVPARTSQSLGRYVTHTSLVIPKQKRFGRPGYFRGIARLFGVAVLLLVLVLIGSQGISYTDAETLLVLMVLTSCAVVVGIPCVDPLRRTLPDLVAGTFVVNRVIKFSPGGYQLRGRQMR